ncbi:hypothetical protein N8I77_009923 [Diaporthe amygdali]|uniref:Uncharacterized protein n=1 Tax=Phomopsis amygdali TaxID=1214568 RepID=A0AAD9W0F6_PHOAM|nr:hypothetical protein N8I77_009923 [Diaporthe amygdali]
MVESRNDVHIRQCNVESPGARPRFCCGLAGEDTECCTNSAALFQLSSVPSGSDESQANVLGAQTISPLPTTQTPPISLLTSPSKSAKTSPPFAAALAAPTTQPSSAPTMQTSSSAVTAVLEMANSDGTGVKDMTVTFGGNEDTLLVATEAPPLQLVDGPPGSTTKSTASETSSATSHRPLASSAGDTISGSDTSNQSSTESAEYSQRLSRGAVVAVGVGLSIAGAGLVAMTVFIIARRRVYKKQEKEWKEHMRAAKAPKEDGGLGGGLGSSTGNNPSTGAYASPSMIYASGTNKLGQTRQESWKHGCPPTMHLSIPATPNTNLHSRMEGPSPVSVYLREMGWRDSSNIDSQSYYSQDSLRAGDADVRGVATYRSDIESPSARSPGFKPTASWLGRHSVYELP